MSREHLWPQWLSKMCSFKDGEGVQWLDGFLPPKAVTIPLCKECNNKLGSSLEEPVAKIFHDIDEGLGLSDEDCEILIRWLWKFEGYGWQLEYFSKAAALYSKRWTLIERVLGDSLVNLREDLVLGIGIIKVKDDNYKDWPIGIDSIPSEYNAIFVAGVFYKYALLVSLDIYRNHIPDNFTVIKLKQTATPNKEYFPLKGFQNDVDAVGITNRASITLTYLHDEFSRRINDGDAAGIIVPRRRVELPL